jgi:hypothetical protein
MNCSSVIFYGCVIGQKHVWVVGNIKVWKFLHAFLFSTKFNDEMGIFMKNLDGL